jgi:predicted acyltransferase
MNPLAIYVLSGFWVISYFAISIGDLNMYSWLYKSVFVPIAGNLNGSLLFGLFHIALYWLVGLILYKRKIFIKI